MQQRARGRGEIGAKRVEGRSRIDVLFQEGAAKIRLPETFSEEMEAVIINTAGGLTGGDRMDWVVNAAPGTFVTATTQACEKIYKASFGTAEINTVITAGAGARIHWLPQETILYDNAALTRRLDVDLADDAEFIGVEAVLLGRTAMGETMEHGLFRDRWRIRREGQLVHAEDLKLDGKVGELTALAPVLGGQVAFATLVYVGPFCEAYLGPVRAVLKDSMGGASAWADKLVVRISASDGLALRKKLIPVISILRAGAAVPKVWNL